MQVVKTQEQLAHDDGDLSLVDGARLELARVRKSFRLRIHDLLTYQIQTRASAEVFHDDP
jgi:hypothetical protein